MKLLVSDYDGTFDTSEKDIKINCIMIANFMKHGNKFALASGRSYSSLMEVVNRHGIPHNYLSCFDGTYLYGKGGTVLYRREMENTPSLRLNNLKMLKGQATMYYIYEDEYCKKLKNNTIGGISIHFDTHDKKPSIDFINEYNILKECNKDYDFKVYTYDNDIFYTIKSKDISKKTAVEYLKEKYKIDDSNIFTIGDTLNDKEMIESYNGYIIKGKKNIKIDAVASYNSLNELVNDIEKEKVKRRF